VERTVRLQKLRAVFPIRPLSNTILTRAHTLRQAVTLNLCLHTVGASLLGVALAVCEVQLVLRDFVAAEV
jgi:hypothetical protein